MKTYKITYCRVENQIFEFEIKAEDEDDAANIASYTFDEYDYQDYKVVHAEEFIHDIQEIYNA